MFTTQLLIREILLLVELILHKFLSTLFFLCQPTGSSSGLYNLQGFTKIREESSYPDKSVPVDVQNPLTNFVKCVTTATGTNSELNAYSIHSKLSNSYTSQLDYAQIPQQTTTGPANTTVSTAQRKHSSPNLTNLTQHRLPQSQSAQQQAQSTTTRQVSESE